MNPEAAMRKGRAAAESLMRDTCLIQRPTGKSVTDPETFEVVPEMESSPVYEGKCKFQTMGQGRSPQQSSGGYQFTVLNSECHIPFGTEVHEDDVITCATSENPSLVGLVFRVTGYAVDSYATAARVPVERHGSA